VTVQQLLDIVGRQCGISSSDWKTNTLYPVVQILLSELAEVGAIDATRQLREAPFLVEGQRTYPTRDICGLPAGVSPITIRRVWSFGQGAPESQPQRLSETDMLAVRQRDGDTLKSSQVQYWTVYPNNQTFVVHPLPDAKVAARPYGVEFEAPPANPAIGDELAQIHFEDLSTLYHGLYVHGIRFQDETLVDRGEARGVWEAGKLRMLGRVNYARIAGRAVRTRYKDL
jgi:hypothetical protein